ncbi:hypothetical protein GQ55_5G450800 [Panicum hallii var. hallii]|uniref:Pectinesterase inhibitor domain-containing protein n=2 Tax=Panicum hallii TaxID=206008 RepID=A0A2T7DQ68_9POAL|nr:hypothetical protein GQ55_5G450800 [Panicum hallii var. hallii]
MSVAAGANPKALLAALLCAAVAAAFPFPGSSAGGASALVSQTCRVTSNPGLCVELLQSSNRSDAATTVRELAVVAVTAARRSALRARMRAMDLSHGTGGGGAVAARLAARCVALYADCLRDGARAVGRVSTMPVHDARAPDAVSALRRFPRKCAGLFHARRIASPLERVSRETEEKLGIASEIVRLSR